MMNSSHATDQLIFFLIPFFKDWLASWPRDVVLEVQKICANEVCPRKMTAEHSGSKCRKLARNSFLQLFQCDFTNVKCSKAIFSISVSGTRINFIFKSCQTVAGRSTIDQFHEFINLIFGRRVFEICPNSATPDKPRGVAPQTGRLLVTALYWLNWLKCGTKISKNFTWKIGIFVTGGDDGAHAICIH